MPVSKEPVTSRRRRSVVCTGYPGEDLLVERFTTHESAEEVNQEDPKEPKIKTENSCNLFNGKPTKPEFKTENSCTLISGKTRRPSFTNEFLRKTTENDIQIKIQNPDAKKELLNKYYEDLEDRFFNVFGDKKTRTISVYKFFGGLLETGLRLKDPRLVELVDGLHKLQEQSSTNEEQTFRIDYDAFLGIISQNMEIVVRAFSNAFIIPDFMIFTQHINDLYNSCKNNDEGAPATYIPQLARVDPKTWGVSVCTVDGQRHSIGDVLVPFTIQSCSKPLTYALAADQCTPKHFHTFVGMEPSGRYFNELCLDHNNKPHNPMINAGAIMTAALIRPEMSCADRFDYIFGEYKRLCGNDYLGFNNAVFLSERDCADRNFALAYFMRENNCFPKGAKLSDILDFYFQLCSLEITAESGAVIAATLANGGINPFTGEAILSVEAVRNTLTLMHSCGMYNYSGQFAFKVGLPAKSGVSGCILLVVPNTLGICLYSPPLDHNGNSCRGVQFCQELVQHFRFHHFDNLRGKSSEKVDPRTGKNETKAQVLFDLLFSVAAGDLSSLKRHAMAGTDLNAGDYDGRTALHVAASEGHADIVEFLLDKCVVNTELTDRWGRRALDDAVNFGHTYCAKLIEKAMHLNLLFNRKSSITIENGHHNDEEILELMHPGSPSNHVEEKCKNSQC